MTACTGAPSTDICPTQDEIIPQLLALLPRGRAWRTQRGLPEPTSTIYKYWYALANVWAWVNQRICALRQEFWCATAIETLDLWMAEYGLPDGCDPYPDLCTKVAALGGSRCDYYTAIAARAGWAITCTDLYDACGSQAGSGQAGCAITGRGLPNAVMMITVSLSGSTAYVGGGAATPDSGNPFGATPPLAGRAYAGGSLACSLIEEESPSFAGRAFTGGLLSCPTDITGIECLLARIVSAHTLVIYETAP